jgi:hypothetical protein
MLFMFENFGAIQSHVNNYTIVLNKENQVDCCFFAYHVMSPSGLAGFYGPVFILLNWLVEGFFLMQLCMCAITSMCAI